MTTETKHRILHWVFKITNLKAWIDFSSELLDSKVYRHEEFENGCEATCNGPYKGDWSKTMLGPSDESRFCLELTYNYGIHHYDLGNEIRSIALKYPGAAEKAKASSYPQEQKEDGSVLVTGPDNSKWLFISGKSENGDGEPFYKVSFSSTNVKAGRDFYVDVLGLKEYKQDDGSTLFGYGPQQTKVELVEASEVTHNTGRGRLAFSTSSVELIYKKALAGNTTILNHPTTLPTKGKADVVVTILKDRDDIELAQVENFDALCVLVPGAEFIDWKEREKKDAAVKKWEERTKKTEEQA